MQDGVVTCHKVMFIGAIADRMFLQNMKNLLNCNVYVISCVTVSMQSLSMVYENPTVIGSIDRDTLQIITTCVYMLCWQAKY